MNKPNEFFLILSLVLLASGCVGTNGRSDIKKEEVIHVKSEEPGSSIVIHSDFHITIPASHQSTTNGPSGDTSVKPRSGILHAGTFELLGKTDKGLLFGGEPGCITFEEDEYNKKANQAAAINIRNRRCGIYREFQYQEIVYLFIYYQEPVFADQSTGGIGMLVEGYVNKHYGVLWNVPISVSELDASGFENSLEFQ